GQGHRRPRPVPAPAASPAAAVARPAHPLPGQKGQARGHGGHRRQARRPGRQGRRAGVRRRPWLRPGQRSGQGRCPGTGAVRRPGRCPAAQGEGCRPVQESGPPRSTDEGCRLRVAVAAGGLPAIGEGTGDDGQEPGLSGGRAGRMGTQDTDSRRPTSGVRFLVVAVVCLLALIAYVHRSGFAFLAPTLKKSLGLGDAEVGYLMAAFLLAYGAFEMPWGLAADRFGVRRLLPLITVGWSLLSAAVVLVVYLPRGWALPFAFLLLLRLLFGLFQAGLFPALSRLMSDWMPQRERATAQGCIWMSSRVGGFLAPLYLGALIFFLGSWPGAFATLSGGGLVWGLFFGAWLRNRPEEVPSVSVAELQRISAERASRGVRQALPWTVMLRSRNAWALSLMYGCGGFAANFFVTFLPTYLAGHRHLPDEQVKWLSSLPLACGVGGCLLGGVVSDRIIRLTGNRRWGRSAVGVFGPAVAGLAFLSTIWVHDVTALGVLLCLTFFGNDLAMGPAWASVSEIGERHAGTLGGKMNMIGNVAGAAGALLAGRLFETPH